MFKKQNALILFVYLFVIYFLLYLFYVLYSTLINPQFPIEISDQAVFIIRGKGILTGKLPYRDFYNNAAPLSGLLWAPIVFFSEILHINFAYIVRILFIFAIISSSLLLFKIERERKNIHAFWLSLIYGVNPFFLYLVFLWGSDEALCPLLILLPIYYYSRHKKIAGTISIVLGMSLKYYPILLFPLIFIYNKSLKDRFIHSALFFLSSLSITLPFYLIAPQEFLQQFEDPVGARGDQGLIAIINSLTASDINSFNILFKILTLISWLMTSIILIKKQVTTDISDITLFSSLFTIFLLLYTKYQISYIVLLFPFLAIDMYKGRKNAFFVFLFYLSSIAYGTSANYLLNIAHSYSSLVFEISAWINVIIFYCLFVVYYVLKITSIKKNNSFI